MDRIKISIPETSHFRTLIQVQIGDINYGGHLANDAYLRIAHEARLQMLDHFGWSEMDFEGFSLIMIDAGIQFMSEAFRGDTLGIDISITDLSQRGYNLLYHFRSNEGKSVAKIRTGMCFFDYTSRRLAVLPLEIRDKIEQRLQQYTLAKESFR